MSKSTQDHFYDWYSHAIGYGYGTGDIYYCTALIQFFHALNQHDDQSNYGYTYDQMESLMGGTAFWLLLNTLCDRDIVEYGSSPRFGWLTDKGERMRVFLDSYDAEALYQFVISQGDDYSPCYPDFCNHTDCNGKGCLNPFWSKDWKEDVETTHHD